MAVARYLAYTSALARRTTSAVALRLEPLVERGLVATCAVVDLEVLYSTRSATANATADAADGSCRGASPMPAGLTRDTFGAVTEVSIRELRNHGGDVVDRAERGECITITRDGRPVAELRPLRRTPLSATALIERFRHLPPIDPVAFRRDVDSVVDQSL